MPLGEARTRINGIGHMGRDRVVNDHHLVVAVHQLVGRLRHAARRNDLSLRPQRQPGWRGCRPGDVDRMGGVRMGGVRPRDHDIAAPGLCRCGQSDSAESKNHCGRRGRNQMLGNGV